MPKARILLVEDDEVLRDVVERNLFVPRSGEEEA